MDDPVEAARATKPSGISSIVKTEISANVPQSRHYIADALADPVSAGFATWLGTVLSIIAAGVAIKQARAARSLVQRIGNEQKRSAINATFVHLQAIESQLEPLWDATPRRGINVNRVIADTKQICHRALGGLSRKRDKELRDLLQTFEGKLDEYLKDIAIRPPNLTADVRRELQDLTSMCKDEIESFAAEQK